jgi:hypothetical protein
MDSRSIRVHTSRPASSATRRETHVIPTEANRRLFFTFASERMCRLAQWRDPGLIFPNYNSMRQPLPVNCPMDIRQPPTAETAASGALPPCTKTTSNSPDYRSAESQSRSAPASDSDTSSPKPPPPPYPSPPTTKTPPPTPAPA